MKILILILFSISVQAQSAGTIAIGYTTKGFGMDAGYLHKSGVQFTAGYNVNTRNTTVPNYTFANAGYRFNITNSDEWFYTATPTVGIAKYKSLYSEGYKTIYGLEVGRTCDLGSLFINGGYCTQAYAGLGLRAFIN